MCKNMMVVGFKPTKDNYKKLWDFLIAATPAMTLGDKDGVGYAALSPSGLWGERWVNPNDAWTYRKAFSDKDRSLKEEFSGTLIGNARYNKFGISEPDETYAVLFHSRMSTNTVSIQNTHPFIRDNTALIHNGVIRNHDAKHFEKLSSTCDSEVILNDYLKQEVANNPSNIKALGENLEGYYACGILSEDKDANQFLDIFRGGSATLWACWVKQLDAMVICTKKDIIVTALKSLEWNCGSFFEIKDEVMIRINAKTGQFMSKHDFKYKAWGYSNHYGNDYWSGYNGNRRWESEGGSNASTTTPTVAEEKKTSLTVVRSPSQELIEAARSDMEANKTIESVAKTSQNSSNDTNETDSTSDPFFCRGEGYSQR